MNKLVWYLCVFYFVSGQSCGDVEDTEYDPDVLEETEESGLKQDPLFEFFEIVSRDNQLFVEAFNNNECIEACSSLGYGVGEKWNTECEKECEEYRSQPYFTMKDPPPMRNLKIEAKDDEQPTGNCGCSGHVEEELLENHQFEEDKEEIQSPEVNNKEVKLEL